MELILVTLKSNSEYKIPEEASGQLHFYRIAAAGGSVVVYGAFKAVDKYAKMVPEELRKAPNSLTDKPIIGAHNFYLFDENLKYYDIFDVTMKVTDIENSGPVQPLEVFNLGSDLFFFASHAIQPLVHLFEIDNNKIKAVEIDRKLPLKNCKSWMAGAIVDKDQLQIWLYGTTNNFRHDAAYLKVFHLKKSSQ